MRESIETETVADLYMSQGHAERARRIYERLLAASPRDLRLRRKIENAAAMKAAPDEIDLLTELLGRIQAAKTGRNL